MPLHVYRHAHVEHLVEGLADCVRTSSPRDPFVPQPSVGGSQSIERWLRHELATRLGVAGNLVFPGTRAALRGAVRWLLSRDAPAQARFWDESSEHENGWQSVSFPFAVLGALRAARHEPSFEKVRPFVGEASSSVTPSELAFAGDVAKCLEKLVADRPEDALKWLASPKTADEGFRWLAELLRTMHETLKVPSPAQLLAALHARSPKNCPRPLVLFGISSPSQHDRHHLIVLAAHMPVHLFALTPTHEWLGDELTRNESLQRAKNAKTADEREAALRDLDKANPLLSANAVVSRDLQVWLEVEGANTPEVARNDTPSAESKTLLTALHQFVALAESMPPVDVHPWHALGACDSVQVHACHGALRQCEALREALLERLASDSSLESRHIIVMTPDVATFGPLVHAVLARPLPGSPKGLPVHVTDLGLRLENPLAEALMAALTLAGERVTASRLLALFAIEPVRRAFDIGDDELGEVATLVDESGLRWAWNAADRTRFDQPNLSQNTVAFALEKLALGALMDDVDELPILDAEGPSPTCPTALRTASRVALFGKLAHALRTIESVSASLVAPRSGHAWSRDLRETLARITRVDDEELSLRRRLEHALDDLFPRDETAGALGAALPLERAAIASLLETAFDLPGGSNGTYGGSVTVCALEPMRSVPFRVVAIVGLSEGAFPRQGHAPTWDPFAKRKAGEPSRTALDRHLFLEALLCARDAFLLFGDGFDERRGVAKPMSAVTHELLAVISRHTGTDAKALVHSHPLQPWSPGSGSSPRASYDEVWVASSAALSKVSSTGATTPTGLAASGAADAFPPAPPVSGDLNARDFARLLENAPRALLHGRLGLELREFTEATPDREPLARADVDAWPLFDALVDGITADFFQDSLTASCIADLRAKALARGMAEGTLEPGSRGVVDLDHFVDEVQSALARLRAACAGVPCADALNVAHRAGPATIVARVPFVFNSGHERILAWITANTISEAKKLEVWCALLAAKASGDEASSAVIAGKGGEARFMAPSRDDAERMLIELSDAFARSRCGPLLRAKAFSYAIAAARLKALQQNPELPIDGKRLVKEAMNTWSEGAARNRSALDDPFTRELFASLTDTDLLERADSIVEEAWAVWGPVLEAEAAAKATAKEQKR